MLTVYTYPISKPDDCYDVSKLSLEDGFLETIRSIIEHQKGGTIWFGYLEGWMLTPHEEVILRKAIRNFHCIVVSHFLSSFWCNIGPHRPSIVPVLFKQKFILCTEFFGIKRANLL
jgi:hypothetical protein